LDKAGVEADLEGAGAGAGAGTVGATERAGARLSARPRNPRRKPANLDFTEIAIAQIGFILRLSWTGVISVLAESAPALMAGFSTSFCPTVGLTFRKPVPFEAKTPFSCWNAACW
jgi:hypothetical protein